VSPRQPRERARQNALVSAFEAAVDPATAVVVLVVSATHVAGARS
jgi:hypothetical protein